MKNKIWIAFLILLCSCRNTQKPFLIFFDKTDIISLQTVSSFPMDSIGKPSKIFSFNKYIILIESDLDSLIAIYNMKDKSFKRIQKQGRGPNEMLLIRQINSFNKNSFYTFDPFKNVFATYSDTNNFTTSHHQKIKTEQINEFFYNQDTILISKLGHINRFTIIDSLNRSQHEFGKVFKYANHPAKTVSFIDGFTEASFNLKRMIWFSYVGDIFELYDFHDLNDIKLIKKEIGIFPHLKHKVKDEDIMPIYTPKTKLGVNSVTSNNKHIFVLYNEYYIKDELQIKDNVYLSDKILVYDWDGNPVKILSLNQKVRDITCNKEDNYIYCLTNNENKEPIITFFAAD